MPRQWNRVALAPRRRDDTRLRLTFAHARPDRRPAFAPIVDRECKRLQPSPRGGPRKPPSRPSDSGTLKEGARAPSFYPSARARRTSGGIASSFSCATSASSPRVSCAWLPKRRTETVRSAASFLPTARMTGIFCSECSRTL